MSLPRSLLALFIAWAAPSVHAERTTYCCSDEQGRQICSDILPQACWGRAYREIDSRGLTVRRVEAPLTPEQRAQRDADARRKQEQERLAYEARKRDQALLDAYSSAQDIETVRDRILGEIQKSLTMAIERYNEAATRLKKLQQEMEFYRKTPAPKDLLEAVRDNESELRAHASVVEAKQKELDATRAKYDEERRRYIELTRGRAANSGAR
jgi:hypothetical protein